MLTTKIGNFRLSCLVHSKTPHDLKGGEYWPCSAYKRQWEIFPPQAMSLFIKNCNGKKRAFSKPHHKDQQKSIKDNRSLRNSNAHQKLLRKLKIFWEVVWDEKSWVFPLKARWWKWAFSGKNFTPAAENIGYSGGKLFLFNIYILQVGYRRGYPEGWASL